MADQNSDDEPDTEDKDPRFYRKPQHVSVPEGEMVRVVCETGGTQPLGEFSLFNKALRYMYYQ